MSGPLDHATRRPRIDNRPAELPPDKGFWNPQSWRIGFDQAQAREDIGTNEARYVNDVGEELLTALRAKGYEVRGGYQQTSIAAMMLRGTRFEGVLRVPGAVGNRRLFQALADAKARFPSEFAKYDRISDQASMMAFANRRQRDDRARADAEAMRLTRGGAVAAFGGGIGAQYDDPDAYLGLLGGGAPSAARSVLGNAVAIGAREATANAVIAGASEPFVSRSAARLGVERTWGDTARDIGMQAGFGAVIGSGGHVAGQALASAFRRAVPAPHRTPEETGALDVVDREADIEATNPYEPGPAGEAMHAAQLARANVAARSGVRPGVASRLGEAHAVLEAIESRGRQFAASGRPLTSSAGAIGVMQVMPSTGPEAARLAGVAWDPARLRTDADYNRRLGRAYYNEMLRQFGGDAEKAAAAYNAGPGSARRGTGVRGAMARAERAGEPGNWRAHLPKETQEYIRQFRERMGGEARAGGDGAGARAIDDMAPEPMRAEDAFATARDADLSPIHVPMPELRRDLFATTAEWRRAQREADDDLAGATGAAPRGAERETDASGVADEVEAEAGARAAGDEAPAEQLVDPQAMAAWRATLARLMGDQGGEAVGALTHPDVGPIDVVWGNDKGGLAHILSKHPEVADDLPEHIARMEVVRRSDNRVRLESGTHAAGVRLDYDGEAKRWLVTAYEREAPVPADVSRAGTKGRDASPARGAGGNIGEAAPAINEAEMLAGFGDAEGGAAAVTMLASLDHDARVRLDADPEATVWIGDDAQPVRLADVLREMDAEDAAIDAARRCL
jgi:hypothetical protein